MHVGFPLENNFHHFRQTLNLLMSQTLNMNYFDNGCLLDHSLIKRLKMRVEIDDHFHQKMKKLKVRGKDLNEMPAEIFCLSELELLELSPDREACIGYQMSNLPPQIANLVNLKILILDTNNLSSLPEQLCQLQHLEQLFLSNNRLKKLPDQFFKLSKLESLHLSNNNFEVFPETICELKILQFLDMSCNEIKLIPNKISNLSNLISLILSFNKIDQLPESICDLKSLKTFWIGHNHLKKLPRKFSNLENLDWGSSFSVFSTIDANPLVDPPVNVCKLGVQAIDDYFQRSKMN